MVRVDSIFNMLPAGTPYMAALQRVNDYQKQCNRSELEIVTPTHHELHKAQGAKFIISLENLSRKVQSSSSP